MNYISFYQQWHQFGCFSIHQIEGIHPEFNRSNLYHWQQAGYIIPLRQQWYCFSDCIATPDFARYVAGMIYAPSYISLHTALAAYEMIPEAVTAITSVGTRKTIQYDNVLGHYTYQTIRPKLFFGYEMKNMMDGKRYAMATPEKALLDLLYLYPEYKTENDMLNLRLDEDFLNEELDKSRLEYYAQIIDCKTLNTRLQTLRKAYNLW